MFNELRFGKLLEVSDLVSENVLDEGQVRAVLQNVLEHLARLDKLAQTHSAELREMRAVVRQLQLDQVNGHTYVRQQIATTREFLRVLEQDVANLRRGR